MTCPACQASVPDGSRFCPSCAAPQATAPDALTREASPASQAAGAAAALARAPGVGRLASSDTIDVGGFTPGAILADRYRIIGLLGRGGMGEVYRADDLKLGQPVALKFLPRDLAGDPVRRERFIGEVRIARQVSHPNLCRVYDIGELDGQYFLTMEYIDGEDLASLLRRIGRLHGPKALDIARQLCAGLAAAHDKGVLHRDLKPANVMIDGRGRVRITDFGLALAAGDNQAGDEIAGTPAYMAPEQLAGQAATRASDIHALGLVLYELYTGTRTFTAQTLAELRSQKATDTPVAPSEIAHDIDPIVERVIQRCLDRDPHVRPGSVAQVAAALPGGDPLAAALAAGETPSPEMVAASGPSEGLSPRTAWLLLGLAVVSIVITASLMERIAIYRRVAFDKRPEVLADRARQILVALGHVDTPAGSAYGFVVDEGLVSYIRQHDQSKTRWDHLPPEVIRFWYRQRSAEPLMREGFLAMMVGWPSLTASFDPPMGTSGDVLVWLDPQGRLLELVTVPREAEDPDQPAIAPDWDALFREAGLDRASWAPASPRHAPAFYADTRAAWVGTLDRPAVPIRVEAAAHRGEIVSLRRIAPWTGDGRGLRLSTVSTAAQGFLAVIICAMVVAVGMSVAGALRNLRMGRGDRRGAGRLARATFGLSLLSWAFFEAHSLSLWQLAMAFMAICQALVWAGAVWLLYLALEPFVRRRWPRVLVSWNRLLLGAPRDPLVARDVLGGCALGAASNVFTVAGPTVAAQLAGASVAPLTWVPFDWFVAPTRTFVANIFSIAYTGVPSGLVFLFLVVLLLALVRKEWLAVVLLAAALGSFGLQTESPLLAWGFTFAAFWLSLVALMRFGLVGFMAGSFTSMLPFLPITTDPSAWYAGAGFAGLLLILAIAATGFVLSVGGRPLFGRLALEE